MLGEFVDKKAEERFFATYDAILRKWPLPAEELDIATRFGPTRVRSCGPDDGPPIVLLSGGMGTSLSWYPHIAELAARHRIHAVDSIGEPGRSIQTAPIESTEDCADWLTEIVDGVLAGTGHEKVHLAGVSRGGWLALNLATRTTDRIAGVVAIEAAGFGVIDRSFIWWSFREIFLWFLPKWVLRLVASGDPDVRHTVRPLLFAALKYKQHLPEMHLFGDDELSRIDVPTRIIVAERSVILRAREVAARLGSLNPHIEVEVVPKTTHGLSLEKPELVTARILEAAHHADAAS
ncbi:alpha/beta fold hydrolase [Amycolatopsis roodepoortensis]|uniref:alpha/beta fold hydrolase n=1 Tax=Amycolatopsis roodepoortensis TaxID=700274 RepID=UPI00214B3D63|nr:alpha/beta fold hydrolase [Amycolatopsis roodepoortensis]UUV32855.1 alpha/beta fold hydrolase [Amycolatopsis roodepoortensis]